MSFVKASILEDHISGFTIGRETILKVRYLEAGKVAYHRYENGPIWMATAPSSIGGPGQRFTISTSLLTQSEFAENVPVINLKNDAGFSWMPDESQILRMRFGESPCMVVLQEPAIEGVSKFEIGLEPRGVLGFGPGKGCYLEAMIKDVFGGFKLIRIYHDGDSNSWAGLEEN